MTTSRVKEFEKARKNLDHLSSEMRDVLDQCINIIDRYGSEDSGKCRCMHDALKDGDLDKIKLMLAAGSDVTQLGWTGIFHVIAYGSVAELKQALAEDCNLEHRDCWQRTPLLFSILVGDTSKTRVLIEAGADVTATGLDGESPLACAIINDNVKMLNWLLGKGFNPEQKDKLNYTPLMIAAKYNAIKCILALLKKDVDIFAENHASEQAITIARDMEIIAALIKAGANINDVNREVRATILGQDMSREPDISEKQFIKFGQRRYGKANPELVDNPVWQEIIKCGGAACIVDDKADNTRSHEPAWNYNRCGGTITALPDGRFVEIAGEYGEYHDPDFCIYNDVLVHDGKGNCDIYAYPREIFTPTEFHTATLVRKYIYIIGNLGYYEDIRSGYTQVFRLDTDSMKIKRIETGGDVPGWINRHKAHHDGKSTITITGGRIHVETDDNIKYIDNNHQYQLCLKSRQWKKLT